MKCMCCNERTSSTRCEGCQRLFCLQCMNTHHDELMIEFETLFGVQNELKEKVQQMVKTHSVADLKKLMTSASSNSSYTCYW